MNIKSIKYDCIVLSVFIGTFPFSKITSRVHVDVLHPSQELRHVFMLTFHIPSEEVRRVFMLTFYIPSEELRHVFMLTFYIPSQELRHRFMLTFYILLKNYFPRSC
jgi:hypothetical protein